MGEVLEVAKVLVAPTMKLLDMVGGAIGTAYEPRRKRKMADATAYEINTIAEAMRNAADMPIVYNQDGVAINSEDFNRLMHRAGTRMVLQETIKQHNIESVVDNAYEILEKEESCSEEPVDQGWINRFFDSVADVSDGDLQKLWGKILAGEIKQPKAYSLRTLETLKNLSKHEAEIFQRVVPLVANYGATLFLTSETDVLRKYGITYDDILCLDECGLLNSDSLLRFNIPVVANKTEAIFNKSQILVLEAVNQTETAISVGVFGLTRAGKELHSVLNLEPDRSYLSDLAATIEKENKGAIRATIHRVIVVNDESITYDDEVLHEYSSSNT